ncbi:ATPase family associated with various cellular activities (AAA) domain-containing protein [Besnoitia besnoiti]|uniref:Dynein heavy chain, cytoplasmic n=1 Tax=Besnoitia besnoiti TaxID=94643 RepID=A0A2A9MGB5_BESBE|nr:ATPase family associated with various cellular activities (AAA) domain-containing protein [Besnoitia besnoiti]PFH34693.1 ATPase family associated with various cellular activities (AAA) domain-containing protein [Besnoitia besnoiti]
MDIDASDTSQRPHPEVEPEGTMRIAETEFSGASESQMDRERDQRQTELTSRLYVGARAPPDAPASASSSPARVSALPPGRLTQLGGPAVFSARGCLVDSSSLLLRERQRARELERAEARFLAATPNAERRRVAAPGPGGAPSCLFATASPWPSPAGPAHEAQTEPCGPVSLVVPHTNVLPLNVIAQETERTGSGSERARLRRVENREGASTAAKDEREERRNGATVGRGADEEALLTCTTDEGRRIQPKEFVQFILRHKSLKDEFCYMNRTGPYSYQIVPFSQKNPSDFLTLSCRGVTHYREGGDTEFISLETWESDQEKFRRIISIPFFADYQKWKTLSIWKTVMREVRFKTCASILQKNLFILDGVLRKALFMIRSYGLKLVSWNILLVHQEAVYTLDHFLQVQAARRQQLATDLRKVWLAVVTELSRACSESLQAFLGANGFVSGVTREGPCGLASMSCASRLSGSPRTARLDDETESGALRTDSGVNSPMSRESRTAEAVSYTERATTRLQCRKLAKFVKVTEYLFLEALMNFARGSTARFVQGLENFTKQPEGPGASSAARGPVSTPESAAAPLVPLAAGVDRRGKGPLPGAPEPKGGQGLAGAGLMISGEKPIFLVHLELDRNGIGIAPTKAMFRAALESALLEGFKAVALTPALTQAKELSAFTSSGLLSDSAEESRPLFASILPLEETGFLELVKRVGRTFDKLFDQVAHAAEELADLVTLYNKCQDADLASFKENDLEAFDDALSNCQDKIEEISAMPARMKIGAFYLDTSNAQKLLLPSLKKASSLIQEHLPTLAARAMATLLQQIKAANARLAEVPTDIDTYVQFNAYLQEMRATSFSAYEARCAFVSEVFDLIKKYALKTEGSLKSQFVELSQALNTLRTQIQFAVYASETNTQRFFEELEGAIPLVEAKIADSLLQLENAIFSTDTSDVSAVLAVLDRMECDIQAITEEVERCRRCQDVLRTEASPFENFDGLVRHFGALKCLFTSKQAWAELCDSWGRQAFATLDVRALQEEVQAYVKLTTQLQRLLWANEAFLSLKSAVNNFRAFLPVALALHNPALQARHWSLICEFFGSSVDLRSPSLLLKDLLAVDVSPFIGDILQIAAGATAERNLEEMLAGVKATWSSLQLPTTVYRATRDKVPILGSLDEVTTALDDSLVTLSSISGSRAAAPIQADVDALHAQLLTLQETLEEWEALQRSWLYLEAIFASPDIRKQLPSEATKFAAVDQDWHALMKETQEYAIAFSAGTKEGRLGALRGLNRILEDIRKGLEDYLQHKREAFPRFFFLSNDELVELLSQARSLAAIQPLFRKCFANLYELLAQEDTKLAEIMGMQSAEGEEVFFQRPLKARGPVEKWLPEVEEAMTKTLKRLLSAQRADATPLRREWLAANASQVTACVSQILWVAKTEDALASQDPRSSLTEHYHRQLDRLQTLTGFVRENLTPLTRRAVTALAIQDLHNRDVVADLLEAGAESPSSFTWLQQLRHYWHVENDECVVVQMDAFFVYGNEYLGAPNRLVVTPLTDRCWLTITTCLKLLKLSGSVAGPAGAGKTETVKELSRMLGYFCLVFNCSESVELHVLEKVFAGVVASGSWACLDEFNRLDVEVLSVVAQHLSTIRHALLKVGTGGKSAFAGAAGRGFGRTERDSFLSASRLAHVKPSAGIFITMNPGYAGRAELPDNLKTLFRPISMVVPDYAAIAEILLFSEGFTEAKTLAETFIKFYRICSEQLSQQQHYDFGLRSVKAVLVLAGELRRQDPTASEERLLLQAICDANEPKFVEQDLPLFYSTLEDFFPSYRREDGRDEAFQQAYYAAMEERGLQPSAAGLDAALRLHKLLASRVGTVLLGAPLSGKSTAITVLADVLARLSRLPEPLVVSYRVLNPKALPLAALFGEFNSLTQAWTDGVASKITREFASASDASPKWIVFDGPIDSLWIESMNTVLDDNRVLCLPNGERIKLRPEMRLLFEATDLRCASPATVSRCGMLYFASHAVSWEGLVESWLKRLPAYPFTKELRKQLFGYFEQAVPSTLALLESKTLELEISLPPLALVASLCKILQGVLRIPLDCAAEQRAEAAGAKEDQELKTGKPQSGSSTGRSPCRRRRTTMTMPFSVLAEERLPDSAAVLAATALPPELLKILLLPAFVFSFIWAFGGGLNTRSARAFAKRVEELFQEQLTFPRGDVFDFVPNFAAFLGAGYLGFPPSRRAPADGEARVRPDDEASVPEPEGGRDDAEGRARTQANTLEARVAQRGTFAPSELEKARKLAYTFLLWEKQLAPFAWSAHVPYASLVVPTKESARASFLLDILIQARKSVFLTGATGVGKTALVTRLLDDKRATGHTHTVFLSFSAHTQSEDVRNAIETKMEKKRNNQLGPPSGKECVLFIDDVNLPLAERATGTQPAIELLRQLQEFKGFYDRKKLHWKVLEKTVLLLAAAPPSSGRQELPARFSRHSVALHLFEPDSFSVQKLFLSILSGYFEAEGVKSDISCAAKPIIDSTIELYSAVRETLLPTPPRPVYVFNFRNVKKLFQGILAAKKKSLPDKESLIRLWAHEASRTFYDRLMTEHDRHWFRAHLLSLVNGKLGLSCREDALFGAGARLWATFLSKSGERVYEEVAHPKLALRALEAYRDEMLAAGASRPAEADDAGDAGADTRAGLVFFSEAVGHVFRLCRILSFPREHALLVGVGGTGKRTLFRLAAFIQETAVFEFTASVSASVSSAFAASLDEDAPAAAPATSADDAQGCAARAAAGGTSVLSQFRECEKAFLLRSGLTQGTPTAFFLTDSQILDAGMLEDVNALLSTGEVPGALDPDTVDSIIQDLSPLAKAQRLETSRDGLLRLFHERAALNLHVFLCMSPVGSGLRERLRLFPSLLSCCTVNFFEAWTPDALFEVAKDFFLSRTAGLGSSSAPPPTSATPVSAACPSPASAETRKEARGAEGDRSWKAEQGGEKGLSDADAVADLCVQFHKSACEAADEFLAVLKRPVYVTPQSFLDLLRLSLTLKNERRETLVRQRSLLTTGLLKLRRTHEEVARLRLELEQLEPTLQKKKTESEQLLVTVERDRAAAFSEREKVAEERKGVAEQQHEVALLQADAQKDLEKAMPALEAALASLDALDKKDLTELKSFAKPPPLVVATMEIVNILLGEKPDWDTARKVLSDTALMAKLKNYDKDHIPPALMKKLDKLLQRPDYTPEQVGKQSVAAMSLCLWTLAIQNYAKVAREVLPKREKLDTMNEMLAKANRQLEAAEGKLEQVMEKVRLTEGRLAKLNEEKAILLKETSLCQLRLERAGILTSGLADEAVRWTETVALLETQMRLVASDALLSAASICYASPFSGRFRDKLAEAWLDAVRAAGLECAAAFSLTDVLSDPIELRDWDLQGLPSDRTSQTSGVLVSCATRLGRSPLLIDPQQQAKHWIKNREAENCLKVTTLSHAKLHTILASAVRVGQPVLIEDIGETLPPLLDAVLLRPQARPRGSPVRIRLAEQEIEVDERFALFLSTKLANPHYLPEVALKVMLVNFTVTPEGLQQQLLTEVVRHEIPDTQKRSTETLVQITKDKRALKHLEEVILQLLSEAGSNILDDEKVIEALHQSRTTAESVARRLREAETILGDVHRARSFYAPVAFRGSLLFFVVTRLSDVEPMYQYALEFFMQVFRDTLKRASASPRAASLHDRVNSLLADVTKSIFESVARGLFDAHKLVFAFLVAVEILKQEAAEFRRDAWQLILRGFPSVSEAVVPENPLPALISEPEWKHVFALQDLEVFAGLCEHVRRHREAWALWLEGDMKVLETPFPFPDGETDEGKVFLRLLLVRALRSRLVISAVRDLVVKVLGSEFIDFSAPHFEDIFAATSHRTPLLYILSPGVDPTAGLFKFAREKGLREGGLHSISLGRGQGPRASRILEAAMRDGSWVLLQNCHLAKSWMPALESFLVSLAEAPEIPPASPVSASPGAASTQTARDKDASAVASSFRLFLTSMPAPYFPVPVLQNCLKVTVEAPSGIRAHLKRAISNCSQEDLEVFGRAQEGVPASDCGGKADAWTRVRFSLQFLHAIVQERRTFGSLGWNVAYQFTESDLEASVVLCKSLFEHQEKVEEFDFLPLQYLVGNINYGGRVTDEWDRRCLENLLSLYVSPEVVLEDDALSHLGLQRIPFAGSLDALHRYVETLPAEDKPGVFGLHPNATLRLRQEQGNALIQTVLSVASRESALASPAGAAPPDDQALQMALLMKQKLPPPLKCRSALLEIPSKLEDHPLALAGPRAAGRDLRRAEGAGASSGRRGASAETKSVEKPNSMEAFLLQETERFNALISFVGQSLHQLELALRGLTAINTELDDMHKALANNQVPPLWAAQAYPSLKALGSWYEDFLRRVAVLRQWAESEKLPVAFWLSGFFFPQGFLNSVLQHYARKTSVPVADIGFNFGVAGTCTPEELPDEADAEDGCYVYGLYIDGARWNAEREILDDQMPGVVHDVFPPILLQPRIQPALREEDYSCPVYKTMSRAGVLSSTGHSTNCVVAVDLPTDQHPSKWVLRGAALVCSVED